MVDFCNVTGYVYNTDGTAMANAVFSLEREDWSSVTNGSISPKIINFTTSPTGFVDINVNPGVYYLRHSEISTSPARVTIPNTASSGIQTIL